MITLYVDIPVHPRALAMTHSGRKLVLALFLAYGAACAQDEAARYYGTAHYAPRPMDEVEVLSTTPSRAFEVIADFHDPAP
jgi:hypothetical protein